MSSEVKIKYQSENISDAQESHFNCETNYEKLPKENKELSMLKINWKDFSRIAKEITKLSTFNESNSAKYLEFNKVSLTSPEWK